MIRTHQLEFHLTVKEANEVVWGLKNSIPKPPITDLQCIYYPNLGGSVMVIKWRGRIVDSIDYASAVRSLVTKVTARHSS